MKNLLNILAVGTLLTTNLSISNMVLNTNINYKLNNVNSSNCYVLGDSLSDNGAGLGLTNANLKLHPNPNFDSITMEKYFYNNSYSNGSVGAEIFLNKLGFKLIPAWNFNLESKVFNHLGNNYAISSETAGDYYPSQQDPGTINKQVQALLLQHQINDKDIVLFIIGSNDMFMAQNGPFSPEWVIDEALNKEKQALNNLITSGIKNIIATNVPDESLIPNLTPEERKKALTIVSTYNKKWDKMIDDINLKTNNVIKKYDLFSFMRTSYFKFKNLKYDVNDEAFNYSDKIVNRVLVNSAIYNNGVSDNNVDKYYFFDSIHPTRVIHKWWGEDMYATFFQSFNRSYENIEEFY